MRRTGGPGGPRRPATRRRAPASRERSPRSDLSARIVTALPALALGLFLIAEGGLLFLAGVLLLGALCLHELFAMYERAHPVRLAGFLGLLALLLAAHYGGDQAPKYVLLVAVAMLPVLFGLALRQRRRSTAGLAITLLGLWWIGFGLAHGVMLRGLHHGAGVVIDVLVGTFVGDTGAYVGGRLFGRRPLAPSVSPNKTVEGLAIGMLCAVAAVWLASRYQSWMPASHAAVLGLGVAALAPLGDLFESFVKRQAGVKDSGRVFGPHGGALDRLDAVLFAVVIGYYIWSAYT